MAQTRSSSPQMYAASMARRSLETGDVCRSRDLNVTVVCRRTGGPPGVFTASWEVTGVLYRGGVIKLPRARSARVFLPAAGAKILAMLTVNHYIYALKLMPLTRY